MASTRRLTILGLLLGIVLPIYYYIESNLESFFIFKPDHLHDLSKRAIAAHGNDTKSMVRFITAELNEKLPGYVNLDEEWIFNNAGGAMGAMYILHAS